MEQKTKHKNHYITFRSILIGILLTIPNVYFLINNHVYLSGLPTTLSLFYNVIICLFILVLINHALQRFAKKWALTRPELITIYSMLTVGSAMAGHDMLQTVVPALTHGFWYATPENEWQNLFWSYIPRWLVVQDISHLGIYYQGETSLYFGDRYRLWLAPAIWWTTFFIALFAVMVAINLLIRESWTVNEKLTFPIARLPYEITESTGRFFQIRLMWIGFAVSGFIALWNGISVLYPNVPQIPTRQFEIGQYFTQRPWDAIGWTPMYILPFAIGLAFFMPLDLSFSIWFFYLFWKILRVIGNAAGLRSLPGFPYDSPQTTGAYFMLAFLALWMSRRHLLSGLRLTFNRHNESAKDFRFALITGIMGLSWLFLFSQRMGMKWWVIPMYFGIYYIMGISITRIRAQLGPPTHEMFQATPHQVLVDTIGTRKLGAQTLTSFAMLWGFNRGYRAHPMPHILESLWMGNQVKLPAFRLAIAMILAVVIGSFTAFWSFIQMSYRDGASANPPWGGFDHLQNWLFYGSSTDNIKIVFICIGAIFTLCLQMLRRRFLWLSLHPAAYALTGSTWTLSWLWFSIFLSWLAKWIIAKYLGIRGYRAALPFFMGLLLGDYVIGGSWIILRLVTGVKTYVFWR